MKRPTCETCPFWDGLPGDDSSDCHRFPPRLPTLKKQAVEAMSHTEEDLAYYYGWNPVTDADEWCGEHPDFPAYLKALAAERRSAASQREPLGQTRES